MKPPCMYQDCGDPSICSLIVWGDDEEEDVKGVQVDSCVLHLKPMKALLDEVERNYHE